MKFFLAGALLLSGSILPPALLCQEDEEEFGLPVPAAPTLSPADKKAQRPAAAPAVLDKKYSLSFCDTVEKKLSAYSQTKGFKKVSWNNADTAAIKEKKRQISRNEDKARELCRLVRAQRVKAEKLKARGSDAEVAAAGDMHRQANLSERTAEGFFMKAKKIREELDPPPAIKK